MREQTQHIRYFLFSQYLSDGIRITLEIILPALICAYFGRLETGLLLSTGALCVSISDAPGPVEHKRNGMLYCNLFVFLMVLLTGFTNHHVVLLGLLILAASFFFTMFGVFGSRASAVGTAALLIMVLRMDQVLAPREVVLDALLVLGGGTWYMIMALLFLMVRPFRQAQRSLGNCIHETSKLLLIKAALYDPETDVRVEYKKMLDQQVVVHEAHDEVREMLFKSKEIVNDTTPTGKVLLITFTDVVDLYDQVTATWYDYPNLRVKFANSGILPEIAVIIKMIAVEVDHMGFAVQSNIPYKKQQELLPLLNELKTKIDAVSIEHTSNLVLKKILVNLRHLVDKVNTLSNYFSSAKTIRYSKNHLLDFSKFVSHQEISFAVLRNNLSLDSASFRHSLRMMITCIVGFAIVHFISYGHHSYWILLTIIFILKPGYSITKQRNIERIAGTIAGGIIGILLIATIHDRVLLLVLMIFCMIGTYTFQRLNYIVTVICMTPYILILFSYLGLGFINIVEERVLDTAIASLLAFVASYFLFPNWESKQLEAYMTSVLKANIEYLLHLKEQFSGNDSSVQEYKLVRKEIYVSTANLFAAFTRMLSEPKNKQQHAPEINEFVVLNNVLSANIAGLFSIHSTGEKQFLTKEMLHTLHRSVGILQEGLLLMDASFKPTGIETAVGLTGAAGTMTDPHLKEHVDFIQKLAIDIRRVVHKVNPKKNIPGLAMNW